MRSYATFFLDPNRIHTAQRQPRHHPDTAQTSSIAAASLAADATAEMWVCAYGTHAPTLRRRASQSRRPKISPWVHNQKQVRLPIGILHLRIHYLRWLWPARSEADTPAIRQKELWQLGMVNVSQRPLLIVVQHQRIHYLRWGWPATFQADTAAIRQTGSTAANDENCWSTGGCFLVFFQKSQAEAREKGCDDNWKFQKMCYIFLLPQCMAPQAKRKHTFSLECGTRKYTTSDDLGRRQANPILQPYGTLCTTSCSLNSTSLRSNFSLLTLRWKRTLLNDTNRLWILIDFKQFPKPSILNTEYIIKYLSTEYL